MLTGHIPVGEEAPDLPQPLEYVVRRCIANRPEDRFTTAEEVLKNFERAYQFLTTPVQTPLPTPNGAPSSGHLSGSLSRPSKALPANTTYTSGQELVALQQSGSIPVVAPPPAERAYGREDYNAPTTWFDPAIQQGQQPGGRSAKPRKTPSSGKRRSFLPLLSAITILVLLAIIGMGYYAYQTVTATSVTVNISPQTHVISQVYTITADPTIQTPNLDTRSIPARAFNSSEQSSRTGQTTGQVNCVLGVFSCQQGVSQDDVDRLVHQMQPALEHKIKQELLNQLSSARGTQISSIKFQDPLVTSDPQVGSVGNSVTVTLKEKGNVGYILNGDVQNITQQLVTQQAQQYGQNYMLLTSSIMIGVPVAEGVDTSGNFKIKIAGGSIVEYQFPASELQAIQDGLKNMKVKDASIYLAHQPGVDPKSVGIHFTRGKSDTLPGDPQQIQIVPINPGSLPPVQLQGVPTPTFTPSADLPPGITPTAAVTPSPTPDNN
jgi:hypothetical protein